MSKIILTLRYHSRRPELILILYAIFLGYTSTLLAFHQNLIISYGDAESHLNIAKRVVDSLTPGFSQLGGIWLPLPHLLMVPFVVSNELWKTGLAGSIVSGLAFIVSAVFVYKLTYLVTKNKGAGIFSFLIFALNPNILFLQSTPMTEIPLISFFILSTYFFARFLKNDQEHHSLILAALFGFCASLSRYDGWFLVLFEALTIVVFYSIKIISVSFFNFSHKNVVYADDQTAFQYDQTHPPHRISSSYIYQVMEGKIIAFSTLAFFGAFIWMIWDWVILGDPLYFTHSPFSANAQQQAWLAKGMLPAYHNLQAAIMYYLVTVLENAGIVPFFLAVLGLVIFLLKKRDLSSYLLTLVLLVPLIFNIFTLFVGQSIIFIPALTPKSFEWSIFNVRYGAMMIPSIALFAGYLFHSSKRFLKIIPATLLVFYLGYLTLVSPTPITIQDGTVGLSASKVPDAQFWMAKNYDQGLVLIDDYARTMSIIRAGIPMKNVIYIGNKPYWDESLKEPEKYATWIVMQKDDAVWKAINDNPQMQDRLYKYFNKAYTSPSILIFKRYEPSTAYKN